MGKGVNPEFDKCIEEGKIHPFSKGKSLFSKELKAAGEDLENAEESCKNKKSKFKWATVQSYYSMFHSARALTYSRGYRERITLFGSKIDYKLVEILIQGKHLRGNVDYYDTWSENSA